MKKKDTFRYLEIITDIYIGTLLLLLPLWVGSGGYLEITEAKYLFYKWTSLVYFALMVLITAELMLVGKTRDIIAGFRRFSITQIFIIVYILICCVSALLSEYSSKVWLGAGRFEGLGTMLLYAAVFLMVSRFGRFKKWYLYLLGAVILINTIIGVLQYAGYNPFMLFPQGYTYHDAFKLYANAFMGTLGNIDFLSAFLSLAVPLLYVYYILFENSKLLLIPFAAGVSLLLLTGVSAGVVGIGIGVFITLPFASNSKQSLKKTLIAGSLAALCTALVKCLSVSYISRHTVINFKFGSISFILVTVAAILAVILNLINEADKKLNWNDKTVRRIMSMSAVSIIVAGTTLLWAYPFTNGTLASIHQLLHGNFDPRLGSSRIQIWQETLKLVPEHLWFGGGPDTLAERLTFTFQRYNEATGTMIEARVDTAHNDYLNILVNTGILSLLAYLAALISSAVRVLKNLKDNKTALFILIGLLCYLIQIFFSFSICIVSPFFWVFFGLLEPALSFNSNKGVKKLGKEISRA